MKSAEAVLSQAMTAMRAAHALFESPVPRSGRREIATMAVDARGLSRDAFRDVYRSPFLLVLSEPRRVEAPDSTPLAAVTIILPVVRHGADIEVAPPRPHAAYEVKKREGANPFEGMVTLGRASNNDIVIADPSISAFHVCFAETSPGSWTVTDASTNGTRLDGERLEPRRVYALRSGATLELAQTMELSFVGADAVFDLLG